jgi:hypothetical protein
VVAKSFQDQQDPEWNKFFRGRETGRAMVALEQGTNRKTILVFFRGTFDGRYDSSYQFWATQYRGLQMHSGFVNHYRKLRQQVIEDIMDATALCSDCTNLHITGYSLGGALATVAVTDLAREFPELCISLTTFGSPRVIKNESISKFPKLICGTSRRVTHGADSVVNMPPYEKGYRHVGMEIWDDNKKIHTNCDPNMEDTDNNSCSMGQKERSFLDHLMFFGKVFNATKFCVPQY